MSPPLPLAPPAHVSQATFIQRYAEVIPLLTAAGIRLVVEMAPNGPGSGNYIAFCGQQPYQFSRLSLLPAGAVALPGGGVLDSAALSTWLGQQLSRWAQATPAPAPVSPDWLGLAVTVATLLAVAELALWALTGGLSFTTPANKWLLGIAVGVALLGWAGRRWYREPQPYREA